MSLLTYALDESQALVHVDDVPKGLKCGCACPHCGAKLYAKNGGIIREHHFAHEHGAECEGAYESSMHRLAKEILQTTGCIMLLIMTTHFYFHTSSAGLTVVIIQVDDFH